jgi:hypothetical protein
MKAQPTILVADSDVTSFFILKRYFHLCGASADWIHCASALETLGCLDKYNPALVVIEPYMHDMDPGSFLASLTTTGAFTNTCGCLLSVLTPAELAAVAAPYNITAYYTKPLHEATARAMMNQLKACK